MRPFFPDRRANHFLLRPFGHCSRGYNLRRHKEATVSEDTLDKAANAIKHAVDDVKDSVHEAQHRSAADIERSKRETLGDELTPSEKLGSALNEAKDRTQAEIDAAKRHIRDGS